MNTLTLKPLLRLLFATMLSGLFACSGSSDKTDTIEAPKMSIHEAAFTGNSKVVEGHIKAGSDLNVKDEFGSSALVIAATFNKPDIAKLLIEAGADINTKGADGSSLLHTAAFFGRKEIVAMLLEKGVDTSVRNSFNATALESVQVPFEAVKMIYDQIAKELGPLGLRLDYDRLKAVRPEIAQMIEDYNNSH